MMCAPRSADTLEYHKVTEIPVENAARLQVLQILDFHSDAATAQSILPGDVQQRQCGRALAPSAERRAQIIDANDFAVKGQDHRQARGAAFCFCQLTHDGKAPKRTGSCKPLQRGKRLYELRTKRLVTSRHGGTMTSARG